MDRSSHAARESPLARVLLVRRPLRAALLGRGRLDAHARKEEQRRAGEQHLAVPQCALAAANAAAAASASASAAAAAAAAAATAAVAVAAVAVAAAAAVAGRRPRGGLEQQRGGEGLVCAVSSPRALRRAEQPVQRRRLGGLARVRVGVGAGVGFGVGVRVGVTVRVRDRVRGG